MRTFWTKTNHFLKDSLGLYFGWGSNSFWCSLLSFFLKKLTKILAHKASYYASTCWWFIKTKLDKVIEKNVSSLWFTILVSQRQINLVWPSFCSLLIKETKQVSSESPCTQKENIKARNFIWPNCTNRIFQTIICASDVHYWSALSA